MNLTPAEKAKELVEKYKPMVNGYVGSSMLTNTEYPETILRNAKKCALIAVDLAIEYNDFHIEFLQKVKQEIEKL